MPSRRTLLAGAGTALAGVAGGAGLALTGGADAATRTSPPAESPTSSPSPHDWPQSQYDLAGTGYNPDASGPTDDVREAWTHDGPDWFRGAAQPTRLGDTLYAVGDGLIALEADTGERKFARRGPYTSSLARTRVPAYRTDTLAVTSPGGVYGLNAAGGLEIPVPIPGVDGPLGSQRWAGPSQIASRAPIEIRPSVEPHPTTNPVAVDGTVYAPIPGTNVIAAVDASSGAERWRVTPIDDDTYSASFARPAVRDATLYVANWPYHVTAYDRADGTRRWQRELEDQMQLCTVPTDAGVVVTSRNGVTLLDLETGDTVWRRDLEGNATDGTAAVAEGTIYLSDGLETFYALELETGEELWSADFERETTPVVADGVVYAVERGWSLVGFDAETGDELFRYEPPEAPLSPPIPGDGRLYLVNRTRVIALEDA